MTKLFAVRALSVGAAIAMALTFLPVRGQSRTQSSAGVPKRDAAKGKMIFTADGCYQCHGREGQGSIAGPVLGPSPTSFSKFMTYVRSPTGQMPPYAAKVISDAELGDVYAFLESLPAPKPAKDNPLLNH
jgi:mono/diheme cytochrome c family protein